MATSISAQWIPWTRYAAESEARHLPRNHRNARISLDHSSSVVHIATAGVELWGCSFGRNSWQSGRHGSVSQASRRDCMAPCISGGDKDAGTSYIVEVEAGKQAGENSGSGKSTVGGIPRRRSEVLRTVDECLREGRDADALEIVRSLQGMKDGLRGFGAARQVPQRNYTLEELRLNKIDTARFLSPSDTTLGAVRRNLTIAAAAGLAVLWSQLGLSQAQLLGIVVFFLFLGTADQVGFYGAGEGLLVDTLGRSLSPKYRDRIAQHEAGHFLVSYLLGVLPRGYTLSSLDALLTYGASNVQAGTTFVDNEFQDEVRKGRISSGMLNQFTCIALAGVATEFLKFERAEGGLSDIQQLDGLLTGLGFTQKKADSQVRWAVLNTVTLLRRHMAVHNKLAQSMEAGKSVGECIEVIELELASVQDV